jgi:hypothetical protein
VKEKGGHHAHETGNAHANEAILSIIDYPYQVVEMLFHGEREMEGY